MTLPNRRRDAGIALAEDPRMHDLGNGRWVVPGKANAYQVNLAAGTCTCEDHARNGGKCKHLWAAETARNRVS